MDKATCPTHANLSANYPYYYTIPSRQSTAIHIFHFVVAVMVTLAVVVIVMTIPTTADTMTMTITASVTIVSVVVIVVIAGLYETGLLERVFARLLGMSQYHVVAQIRMMLPVWTCV